MKKLSLLSLAAICMMVACAGNNKPAGQENEKDSTSASITTNVASAAEEETPIDLKAFGFKGKVAEVTYQSFSVENEDAEDLKATDLYTSDDAPDHYAFSKEGRIIEDPWNGVYHYNDQGDFIKGVNEKSVMRRDEQGRICFYRHAEDDEDDCMFTNEFTYDAQGRITKIDRGFWEASIVEDFFYEGDSPYPNKRIYHRDDQGFSVDTETLYRYTKFDENGNWIERELRYTGTETDAFDESANTRWKGANIEKRVIRYY